MCLFLACATSAPAPVTPAPAPVAPAPAPAATVAPSPSAIEATANGLVASLAAGKPVDAEAHFDATMKAALTPAKLDEVWRSIVTQYGSYQKITEASTTQEAGYRVVYLWTKFERGMVTTKVVFGASGEVAGLFFLPVRQEQPGSIQ
jgi:hypothetical protein